MSNLRRHSVCTLVLATVVSVLYFSAVADASAPAASKATPMASSGDLKTIWLSELLVEGDDGGEGEVCPGELEFNDAEAAADCKTTPAAAGDPLCADGGTKCKNPGAECKLGNGCGVCRTTTVNDLTGHRCTGCTCFPF
jgi:hypothetical protein